MLPNFLVIGAMKAGTTTLYYQLAEHPDVYMSPDKEPGFLVLAEDTPANDRFAHFTFTWAEYTRLFDGVAGERAVGEASTAYLVDPRAPGNIRTHIPDCRLVAVLRDPADRALSAYHMEVRAGREERTLMRAIDDEVSGRTGEDFPILAAGRYGEQLTRYRDLFPEEQIQVHLYEDFVADPLSVVQSVYGFIGVDPTFVPSGTARNVGVEQKVTSATVRRVQRAPGLSMVRRIVPPSVRAGLRSRAIRKTAALATKPMTPEERRRLVEIYEDDIRLTESILGRDLTAWRTV